MAASHMGQVSSYYNPAAAAYGSLSAASVAAAAAAAAAQQSAISGLSAPAQVRSDNSVYLLRKASLSREVADRHVTRGYVVIKQTQVTLNFKGKFLVLQCSLCLSKDFKENLTSTWIFQ